MIAERLGHADRLARLCRRAVGDLGGGFDFGARILDRPDQPGGGLCRLAHRHRGLLGGGGDFARLAQHRAGRCRTPHRLFAEHVALVGRGLDHRRDPVAKFRRQRVARDPRRVRAVRIIDRDGNLAFQRGQPHQRVDIDRQLGVRPVDPPHQHLQRGTVTRADHRQQRHRRHTRDIGRRDGALDRLDPGAPARIEEAIAQEGAADLDHLLGLVRCPDPLVGETAQPLFPIRLRDMRDLGSQRRPDFAARAAERSVEVENPQPCREVDRGRNRAGNRQVGGGQDDGLRIGYAHLALQRMS